MRAADPDTTPDAGLAEIQTRVRAGLVQVEQALRDAVVTADPFVQEAASYLVEIGRASCRERVYGLV